MSIAKHKRHLLDAPAPRARSVLDRDYGGGPDGSDCGVGTDGQGNIVLSLGLAQTFTLPRDAAISLALLILKRAGCDILTEGGRHDG